MRWKWLRVAQKRQTTMTYRSLPTYSRDLGINLRDLGISRCKTQVTEGGGEEAKVKTNTNNLEVEVAKSSTSKMDKQDIWIPPHLF